VGPRARTRPSVDAFLRGRGWGSRWGSPGEHRAVRFGHEPTPSRISERNKASKSRRRGRRTTGGQALAVTRGPLLGREKLWRACIGGKARRRSQACVAGAWQPDEPQGRLRDATSPRTCWWRKPSRPGGTARAEHVRRWEAPCRSVRKLAGVDSSRHPTEGWSLRNPTEGARLRRAGRQRDASSTAETPARDGQCGLTSTLHARGARRPESPSAHARTGPGPSPGKAKRPGTPHGEAVLPKEGPSTAAGAGSSEACARLIPHAHRADP